MKTINYVSIPSTIEEDINQGKTTWRSGKCVSIDEGNSVTLYIGHRKGEVVTDMEGNTVHPLEAYPIKVSKPVNRDKAINAAEMEAYRLNNAMDVASFGASMARKFRENPDDSEVKEHDKFISWVKKELSGIGY